MGITCVTVSQKMTLPEFHTQGPRPPGAGFLKAPSALPIVNRRCAAVLYGRGGRLQPSAAVPDPGGRGTAMPSAGLVG
jgi:hypothetical protein